jgi:hypothetical protein
MDEDHDGSDGHGDDQVLRHGKVIYIGPFCFGDRDT